MRGCQSTVDLLLLIVVFVPLLSHNLLSLKQFTRGAGHTYRGDGDGVTSVAHGSLPPLSGNSIECEDTVHEATVHVQQSSLV